MARIDFKLAKALDRLGPKLEQASRELKNLPKAAFNFWVSQTPKQTGNARRNTNLTGDTINANYPYAKRLDQGYSKQAPRGMSQPTEAYIRKLLKQKLGR